MMFGIAKMMIDRWTKLSCENSAKIPLTCDGNNEGIFAEGVSEDSVAYEILR